MEIPAFLATIEASGEQYPVPDAKIVPSFDFGYSLKDGWRIRVSLHNWSGSRYTASSGMDWVSGGEISWIVFKHCHNIEHALACGKAWLAYVSNAIQMGIPDTEKVVISYPNSEQQTVTTPNEKGYYMGRHIPQDLWA